MNNKRRKRLREAGSLIGNAMSIVEQVKDEEQDSLDNIPEGLQESERCTLMEDAVSNLEDAISSLSDASNSISSVLGG